MERRVFHVTGWTQFYGTCKFHLFKDCPQLQKKRVREMSWGTRDATGAIHEDTYDVKPHQICKLCQRREARAAAKK